MGDPEFLKIWVPILTAVVGGGWAFWLYLDRKREASRIEARTRRIESRRPFLELQLRLYVEAAQVVGRLVAEPINSEIYKESEKRFWALYWSELTMVESEKIEEVMTKIGDAVKKCRDTGNEDLKSDLRNWSYCLAHTIRSEIETAWGSEVTRGQESKM